MVILFKPHSYNGLKLACMQVQQVQCFWYAIQDACVYLVSEQLTLGKLTAMQTASRRMPTQSFLFCVYTAEL